MADGLTIVNCTGSKNSIRSETVFFEIRIRIRSENFLSQGDIRHCLCDEWSRTVHWEEEEKFLCHEDILTRASKCCLIFRFFER